MASSALEGPWDLETTASNYEDYLKEVGVSWVVRKAVALGTMKPRMISNSLSFFILNYCSLIQNSSH